VNQNLEIILYKKGKRGTIYTIKYKEDEHTELEKFIIDLPDDYKDIGAMMLEGLDNMADRHGFEEQFFKLGEGNLADNVVAFGKREIRLYCLRFSTIILIIGNGGYKPKDKRTYEEVPELYQKVKNLQSDLKIIDKAIKEKDLTFGDISFNEKTPIEFNIEDYE